MYLLRIRRFKYAVVFAYLNVTRNVWWCRLFNRNKFTFYRISAQISASQFAFNWDVRRTEPCSKRLKRAKSIFIDFVGGFRFLITGGGTGNEKINFNLSDRLDQRRWYFGGKMTRVNSNIFFIHPYTRLPSHIPTTPISPDMKKARRILYDLQKWQNQLTKYMFFNDGCRITIVIDNGTTSKRSRLKRYMSVHLIW